MGRHCPVVAAIRVLERIVPPGELLFASDYHRGAIRHRGKALGGDGIRERITDFIAFANQEAARHGLTGEFIPPDPAGAVTPVRFRRSLAWHISRQPGGLVALAIQYGHLRTVLDTDIAGGYGTRSRRGIHDLIDIETALSTAETAADLHKRYNRGEGVSGPAARQALHQASTTPRFEGTTVKADFARKYLSRDGAVLYDNPHALLLCRYKRDLALCERTTGHDVPALDRCVAGCGNMVRTDIHAQKLRAQADRLARQAAHQPDPIARRLLATSGRLRGFADTHDRTPHHQSGSRP
ncbi:hypothetical protein [Streptomyces naphthomycinicus]|uniref:hypothetical protein n=1 Tax=Streptomyces naphthomycinicus TaxID=2872625 RepID=UPI001CED2B07|nr:hypothetical protein [Streptomyces sp. TML10]